MQERGLPATAGNGLRLARARPALPVSGHVFRVERKRGPVWYAKYRLPDGRQVQRKLGAAWTGRGRPAGGYLTRRLAQELLEDTLAQARKGTLPGLVRTGVTVRDAAAEYLPYIEHDRERKPSTVKGYRWLINAQVLPSLGELQIEDVTTERVEAWLSSRKVRAVPLAPAVAKARARLSQREMFTGEDDLVFVGDYGTFLDGSALRRRYKAALTRAGLRPLRFHDLLHTFGTRMIAKADIRRVQEWMGHADVQTTMRYLHYAPRAEDTRLVAEAFEVEKPVDAEAVGPPGDAEEVPGRP